MSPPEEEGEKRLCHSWADGSPTLEVEDKRLYEVVEGVLAGVRAEQAKRADHPKTGRVTKTPTRFTPPDTRKPKRPKTGGDAVSPASSCESSSESSTGLQTASGGRKSSEREKAVQSSLGDKVKAADKVKWTTKMKKKHFVEVKGLFRERLNPRPDDISAEGIRVEVQKKHPPLPEAVQDS